MVPLILALYVHHGVPLFVGVKRSGVEERYTLWEGLPKALRVERQIGRVKPNIVTHNMTRLYQGGACSVVLRLQTPTATIINMMTRIVGDEPSAVMATLLQRHSIRGSMRL